MDYTQSFAISAAGMNIERMRVDVAALNLANANTVQGVGGTSYQPLRVVAQARSAAGDLVGGTTAGGFGALISEGLGGSDAAAQAAPLVRIVPANTAPRLVYEPSHPLANERGFVAYAGIDTATEMVSMMSATRAYEANVSAMNTSRTLALRALDIGSNA
ncbi:flagellar basal body rod protein FlgC (plasmid) [Variovorax sp. PDNC026]|uniref:flagellar basal body rod protein FlgC n=1 Tax=Variovorax sp. PDNC026 TaxID=2811425 RepID=UPI0019642645|nr:flagellar basal body rod protein FlgC [Variovorax sp. PDNC026]QRY35512.1 flagellar basal body rod protein FlgC [Variovorax sp. PDNC026]